MKYSIIITTYKRSAELLRCVNSFQNLTNAEVIIINDDPLKKYTHASFANIKNLIIINNKKNLGLSISRNKGIQYSQGEYVYLIDDDDWASDYLVKFLNKEKKLRQVTKLSYFSIHDNNIQKKLTYPLSFKHLSWFDKYNSVEVSTAIFKRSFLIENNIEFPNNRVYYEDLIFWQLVLENVKFIKVIKNTFFFYDRTSTDESITRKNVDFNFELMVRRFVDSLEKSNVVKKDIVVAKVLLDLLNMYSAINIGDLEKLHNLFQKYPGVRKLPPYYWSQYKNFKKRLKKLRRVHNLSEVH